jgi:hypothetical protein
MYPRRRMVRQALRLGLVMTLAVLALNACGGGGEKEAKARPLPEEQQALRPGTYSSEEFKPSLSFRVGEDWTMSPPETSDTLGLIWGQQGGLGFVNVHEVFKPTKTGTPNVVKAPKDLVGWLQQHPYLQTDKPEPVMIGGVKGVQFDMVIAGLPDDHFSVCGSDCVDLYRSRSGFKFGLGEEDKEHEIVLEDVEGKTVIIRYGGPATEFDELAPAAQKVVDSVKWRDS